MMQVEVRDHTSKHDTLLQCWTSVVDNKYQVFIADGFCYMALINTYFIATFIT